MDPVLPVFLVVGGVVLGFVFAMVLTSLVRIYALRARMVDSPNHRTSHQGEVPRGGGLSIIVVMLLSLPAIAYLYPDRSILVIMVVTVALGALGWVDDKQGLGPFVKIAAQFLVAIFAVVSIGELDGISIAGYSLGWGYLAVPLSVLWMVWMTNAYNFMDGIDGIAASHTGVVACVMGVWFAADQNGAMALFCYVIMASALGFLVWNWAPARIFMGDVGSITLGGVFAVLAIVGNSKHGIPLTAYIVLFGVFLFDTIVTLVRRLLAGKIVWKPHREHFYQRATRLGLSHAQVTVAVSITTIVLAGLASLEKFQVSPTGLWPVLALLILVTLASAIHIKERHLD